MKFSRRHFLQVLAALGVVPAVQAQYALPRIEIWKSPTCGCCKDWISHLQANGFSVQTHDVPSTAPVRARLRMPEQYGSCHTASAGGYVFEGHVPAREIKRLLNEKPAALGLAVPGMPVGSPGMDGPQYQGRRDPYDVLLITADGSARSYQAYR